jgi:hypothetical protein
LFSSFGQIQKLIELQYDIAEEMPNEIQLTANTCPAKLNDPEDICAGNIKNYRSRLLGYLTRSISEGVRSGEFDQVPIEETAILILSVINGIVHYNRMSKDPEKKMKGATVGFCRRSLMKFSKVETKSAT